MIRKAVAGDIPDVAGIYHAIAAMEAQRPMTGWKVGIYPTGRDAMDSLEKGHLFVMEKDGYIVATGRINQEQQPEYALCDWQDKSPDEKVMVLHTLCVDPDFGGRGYAREFLQFYEDYAREHGCTCLRIDTNAINTNARAMYAKLGYREAGIVPCTFNGIEGVDLVMLEKSI